ncbi:serine hydrolase domain-containing protein [Bacteroidota bacterium]
MKSIESKLSIKRYEFDTRKIRFLWLFTFLLILSNTIKPNVSGLGTEPDSLKYRIDEIFKEWDSPDSPGGAVAIVKEGKVIFMEGYGSADLEMSIPFTPLTKLYLASLSKQFTGYCVAKLILDGKLSLDDDIRKYIPEMPFFQSMIKVRDLVFQKSGLRDFYGLLPLTGFHINDYLSNNHVLNILYKQKDLNFTTGKQWEYCNTNYFLLAEIVKRITGESIKQWAEKNLFTLLNMNNTFFVDSIETIVTNRAKSYHQNKDGSFTNDPFLDVSVGHTGLYSTAEDISKWLIHIHNMNKNEDPLFNLMLQTDTLNNGNEMEFYSFGLFKSPKNAIQYWHRGSFFGYKSIISYYPEKDFGLVILGNVQKFNRIRYAREITQLFYPELASPGSTAQTKSLVDDSLKNKRIYVDASLLKKYEGNYVVDSMTIFLITKQKDFLSIQEVGDSRITNLIPIAQNKFRNSENSIIVSFSENNEGLIDRMSYHTKYTNVTGEPAKVLSSAQDAEIIGDYYNDELEVLVRIEKTNNGLIAYSMRLGKIELYPTFEDEFRCNHDFFSYISFYRNSNKFIVGFLLDGFFVSNIKFNKRSKN